MPGARRLARAARAGAAAARGQARPAAPGPLRHARRRVLEVVEAVARRRFARQDLRRARAASIRCCCCRRPRSRPRRFGELLVGTPGGQLVPLAAGRRHPRDARARRSSTASRCSAACSSRSTCAGAIWSASSTTRSSAWSSAVKLPHGVHVEWGGQFENFTRASKRLGLVVPHGAGDHLRDAVPDVRRRALRGRGVRRRAVRAGRRRAGARACAGCRSRSRRRSASSRWPASPCSTASSWPARCARGCESRRRRTAIPARGRASTVLRPC